MSLTKENITKWISHLYSSSRFLNKLMIQVSMAIVFLITFLEYFMFFDILNIQRDITLFDGLSSGVALLLISLIVYLINTLTKVLFLERQFSGFAIYSFKLADYDKKNKKEVINYFIDIITLIFALLSVLILISNIALMGNIYLYTLYGYQNIDFLVNIIMLSLTVFIGTFLIYASKLLINSKIFSDEESNKIIISKLFIKISVLLGSIYLFYQYLNLAINFF